MKIQIRRNALLIICSAMTFAGCATTTLDAHSEKYADLSLHELLGEPEYSIEEKDLIGSSLLQRASIDAEKGKKGSAIKHAKLALEISPDDDAARMALAEAYLRAGKFPQAEEHFKVLTDRAPSALAHQGHGLSLLSQDKLELAQQELQAAVKQDDKLWRSWNGLGIVYDQYEDWEHSEKAYKAALQINGHNTILNNNLGVSYMQQSRIAEALIAFENERVLRGKDAQPSLAHRTAIAMSGDMNKARSNASDGELAQLYNSLGVKALNQNEKMRAIDYFKRAIAISPHYYDDAENNLNLAKSALP